jgi:AcrR family transcriptional regulator
MPLSDVIPVSASRAERKRARNRDALVAAARDLFVRLGFEATTIAAIAEAADLGFGTFYRYFPDKEAVLAAVIDAARAEIDRVLDPGQRDHLPASEALAALTADFARMARRNQGVLLLLWRISLRAEGPRPGGVRRPLSDGDLPVMLARAVQRIIERGVASGEFVTDEPTSLARFVTAAHMYLLVPTAVDEATLVDTLQAFELRGLVAPPKALPSAHAGRRAR